MRAARDELMRELGFVLEAHEREVLARGERRLHELRLARSVGDLCEMAGADPDPDPDLMTDDEKVAFVRRNAMSY